MHLYQNYQQKSAFLSKLQGFEPNKREKPREEEHFYQNLQRFKRRKMKNPKKTLGWAFFFKKKPGFFKKNRVFFSTRPDAKFTDHVNFKKA